MYLDVVKKKISKFNYLKIKTYRKQTQKQSGEVFIINKKLFSFFCKGLIKKRHSMK